MTKNLKGIAKKCGLFVLSFVVFSSAFSIAFSNNASAASVYDKSYQTVDKLVLMAQNYGSAKTTCQDLDITKNYTDIIQQYAPDYFSSYSSAVSESGRWAISVIRSYSNPGYRQTVVVSWSEDKSLSLRWTSSGVYVVAPVLKTVSLAFYGSTNGGSSCTPYVSYVGTSTNDPNGQIISNNLPVSDTGSSSSQSVLNYLVYSDHENIPPDYSGPDIVSIPKEKYTPKVTLSIQDRHVSGNFCITQAQPACSIPPGFSSSVIGISYRVVEDLTGKEVFAQSGSLVSHQMLFDFDVNDYSKYVLEANYYVPIPFIKPDNQVWNKLKIPFQIEGSSYLTSSGKQKCTSDGVCENSSPLRDCSQYWGDISKLGQAFDCTFYNFGAALNQFFSSLFRPDTVDVRVTMDDFKNTLQDRLGMLYQFYDWFTNTVYGLVIAPRQFACHHVFSPFFGKPIDLNMCVLEDQYPQIWGVTTLVIRTTAVFLSIFGVLRQVSRVMRLPVGRPGSSEEPS